MDKEDQAWYEYQFDMFSTQGWKDLVDKINEMRVAYNSLRSIGDEDQLYFKKGQLDMLDWLASWQNLCEENYKALTENDE